MKNYIALYGLRPGDEIIVPKSSFNVIKHHALYLGYDHSGTHWVIHNNIHTGVALVEINAFFSQCIQVNKIIRFSGTNFERKILIQRSLQSIGRPYDMIDYNCEHFVTDMKTGKAKSRQIEAILLTIFAVFIVGLGVILAKKGRLR